MFLLPSYSYNRKYVGGGMLMLTCNNREPIPEYFYVFVGPGPYLWNQVNMHNFRLRQKLISSGIENILINPELIPSFVSGNINYLPYEKIFPTMPIPSSFIMTSVSNYNLEHSLEWLRRNSFSTYPSRLSGLYAFGDFESCIEANKRYGWSLAEVLKFKLANLGSLNEIVKVGKFNMEIVSMLRSIPIYNYSMQDQELLFSAYWEGKGNISLVVGDSIETVNNLPVIHKRNVQSETIYEYLIEGILELA